MNPFLDTLGAVGGAVTAIAGGIVFLAIFFRLASWSSKREARLKGLAVRGVLSPDSVVTVHLSNGDVIEGVRFVGFTDHESIQGGLPSEMAGMAVLEESQGRRRLVRAKDVRMIVVHGEDAGRLM